MGLFQQRLHLVLQPYPIAPQLILLVRNCPPQTLLGIGHKAQNQFPGHQPLHQAFGVGEIPRASPSPRLDCACAKCNVPDLRLAPSRFSRSGFQYLSSASHTGFQYWAVDSITSSSASFSSSHAASVRSCAGLLPNILRSNWSSISTSERPVSFDNIPQTSHGRKIRLVTNRPLRHEEVWADSQSTSGVLGLESTIC